MKRSFSILTTSILAMVIAACGRSYNLNDADLKYIPYDGNEILVFQSDKERLDTIFLRGIRNFTGCIDPLAIAPDKCEGKSLICSRTDPNYDRYLDGKRLVEIVATKTGETNISFDIAMKGSWFYIHRSYSLSSFDSIPLQQLSIESEIYNDVKVFEAGEYARQFENRDNYAERFYWSVSKGFLGLDRRDEKWRLTKKYVP